MAKGAQTVLERLGALNSRVPRSTNCQVSFQSDIMHSCLFVSNFCIFVLSSFSFVLVFEMHTQIISGHICGRGRDLLERGLSADCRAERYGQDDCRRGILHQCLWGFFCASEPFKTSERQTDEYDGSLCSGQVRQAASSAFDPFLRCVHDPGWGEGQNAPLHVSAGAGLGVFHNCQQPRASAWLCCGRRHDEWVDLRSWLWLALWQRACRRDFLSVIGLLVPAIQHYLSSGWLKLLILHDTLHGVFANHYESRSILEQMFHQESAWDSILPLQAADLRWWISDPPLPRLFAHLEALHMSSPITNQNVLLGRVFLWHDRALTARRGELGVHGHVFIVREISRIIYFSLNCIMSIPRHTET